MSILILTGPAGVGKNTVAAILSKKRERIAVIDVDVVRQMLIQPHKAPWDGEEGHCQQVLGVENSCALAINFVNDGCDVVLLDVLSDETTVLYKKLLDAHSPSIVLLLPSFDEVTRRNATRPQFITDDEIAMLYKSQVDLIGYDEKIDTTQLSPEETAEKLNASF